MRRKSTIEDQAHRLLLDKDADLEFPMDRQTWMSIKGDLPALKNRKGRLLEALIEQAIKPKNFIELDPGKVYYCKPIYGVIGDYQDVAEFFSRYNLETNDDTPIETAHEIKAFMDVETENDVENPDYMEGRKIAALIISWDARSRGKIVRVPPDRLYYFSPLEMWFNCDNGARCFELRITGWDATRNDYSKITIETEGPQLLGWCDREVYKEAFENGYLSV